MKRHSELHDALTSGDLEWVTALLHDGADIEEHNSFGWTPLMAASLKGQVDIARLLLDHGAELNATDREGKSAIHYAGMRGGAEAVRLLVRLGANINAVESFGGYTPLHLAAGHCNRKIVQDTCAALLAAGADVNARNKWGSTALWSAALAMRGDLVDFLLQHGAEIDIRDNSGRTVLIFVTTHFFGGDIIERLLAHGAQVNARDAESRTALMYAAISARRSIMDTLLDGGADINLQDIRGATALMYAAGEAPAASEIGVLGCEASTRDVGAQTAAWDPAKKAARLAKAYHERAEAIRHLLARGADPTLRDAEGRTALDVAMQNGNVVEGDNAEMVTVLTA
ncbi:hypothetical protein CCAX7_28360 [Capsulimonas corticalis]|uniref:Uncharacterized protein n=1 Tax=Capsulimonas corticalis TaxID=2219043 RepID=A0A402CTD0_9BACT|nr:ankyrin repeat domain-containing protein [Capsulimonas corticalis]BDI30785.1 hypothetical protein CCAX7_28360 [Capsulimonas corticalis]